MSTKNQQGGIKGEYSTSGKKIKKQFGEIANKQGLISGFIKRQSKKTNLTGLTFLRSIVLTVLSQPLFTEKQFHQKAISMGIKISPQGLIKRLDESCSEYLRTVLEQMVKDAVGFEAQDMQGLLARFSGVYLGDSTVVSLPEDFIDIYPGCGGSKGANAALKVQVNYDLKAGEMRLALQRGKAQDRSSPLLNADLPKAALDLHDLGYFNLARFKRIAEQDAYFLSRYRMGTVVFYEGQEVSLYQLLKQQKAAYAEFDIELGRQACLRCRLVAHKLP